MWSQTMKRRSLLRGMAGLGMASGLAGCNVDGDDQETIETDIIQQTGATAASTDANGVGQSARPSISMNGEAVHEGPSDINLTGGLFAKDDGDGTVSMAAAVQEGTNVGGGAGRVFQGNAAGTLAFRTLKNIGAGQQIIRGVAGPAANTVDFRSLRAVGGGQWVLKGVNGPNIDFRGLLHLGGNRVFKGLSNNGNSLEFRGLTGGQCISVTPNANNLQIDYTCPIWMLPPGQNQGLIGPQHPQEGKEVEGIETKRCVAHQDVCTDSAKVNSITPFEGDAMSIEVGHLKMEFRPESPFIKTSFNGITGPHMTKDGWSSPSSRTLKEDITPISGSEVLEEVRSLEINEWTYEHGSGARHMGPMAEDFYASFGLGSDAKTISPLDAAGVALGAIKGLADEHAETRSRLVEVEESVEATAADPNDVFEDQVASIEADRTDLHERVSDLEAENSALHEKNEELAARNEALAERLAALEDQVAAMDGTIDPSGVSEPTDAQEAD